ncbi:hypothetical protein J4E82_011721 [Alternaria postmessia]|uniref:uncharacterized protein n=1 Tax=Alternaria postmessia TaxID=1187938 RepID=UPI002225A8B5|nr:uncharacterized protein J4E82_011721 [Alternaria postmessia]KAI5361802.1 hypothetical protein J4E82_011721 [Alternaria postmessia]
MDSGLTASQLLAPNAEYAGIGLVGGLPDVPVQGSFTLEEMLRHHHCVIHVLGEDVVREGDLSGKTTLLDLLKAIGKLLSLFDAAKATYFNKKQPPRHSSEQCMQQPGLVCLESTISIGRQVLNEEESALVARDIVKSSVMQLAKEVTELKKWFYQFRSVGNSVARSDGDSVEIGEMERVLTRIWALVAGIREQR